jgi:hypothetical protein
MQLIYQRITMNYIAFTALIITFHNLSFVLSLIIASLLTMFFYGVFLRKSAHRLFSLSIVFLLCLILGVILSEKIFQRRPIEIEVVRVS